MAFLFPRNLRKSIYGSKYMKDPLFKLRISCHLLPELHNSRYNVYISPSTLLWCTCVPNSVPNLNWNIICPDYNQTAPNSKSQNLTMPYPVKASSGNPQSSCPWDTRQLSNLLWQLNPLHNSTESQCALYTCCSKLVHSSPVASHFYCPDTRCCCSQQIPEPSERDAPKVSVGSNRQQQQFHSP